MEYPYLVFLFKISKTLKIKRDTRVLPLYVFDCYHGMESIKRFL